MPVHLVPKNTRTEPRALPPVYSDAVRGALCAIRIFHAQEEARLDPEERLELASALQLLAIAALLEAQIHAPAVAT